MPDYSLPPLVWLRAFEAAARHGSFTAAARELNLTQAAVSHQVRSLEEQLGFAMFERFARRLRLTDMGAAYLPPVRKTFDELAAVTAGLFGPNDSKPLLVRAPVTFAALWLAPRLKTFLDAYPSIDVRLISAVWTDVVRDESPEIDIRFGDGHWPGFKSELIVGSGSIAVCPRGMASGRGDAARLRSLAARDLIHVTGPADLWRRLFQAAGAPFEPKGRAVNVDTTAAALELSVAGVGPATVLECLAAPYLDDGRLTKPVALVLPSAEAHYVLIADGRTRHRPEMTLFRDWLLAQK